MNEIILPKIVSIGIYNSQIVLKDVTITQERKTEMFEIEIPIEKGGVSYIDSEQMAIKPNMIICAKPNQIRHTRLPFKCYYIHMILNEGKLYDILMNTPTFVFTGNFSRYQDIFAKLCKYFNTNDENDEIILHSLILELAYTLSDDAKRLLHIRKSRKSKDDAIEKTVKYINENISADLSLKALAENVSFSPIHFHNCFKEAMGKTLHEYIENERLKIATELLITTDMTLSEIAYQCGFSSQAYFSYVFKQKMCLTPREYAKKMHKRYTI